MSATYRRAIDPERTTLKRRCSGTGRGEGFCTAVRAGIGRATRVSLFVSAIVIAALARPPVAPAQPAPPVLELVSVSTPVQVDNAIFSEATGALNVTVGHTGGPTQYFVTVSRGGSSTFDPRQLEMRFFFGIFAEYLDYNIFTPSGAIAKDLTVPISQPEVIHGGFGNTGSGYATQNGVFDVVVPADQFVRRGMYRDEVIVSLYQGRASQSQSAVLIDQEAVQIRSETLSVAQIALAGQSQYTMDFGVLTEGAQQSTDLLYRTNTAFRIDAASENGGVMVNVFQPASLPIDYVLTVDGRDIDLSSPRLLTIGLFGAGSSTDFASLPLSVTIGSVDNVLPGRFEDVITFTISTF